MILKKIFVFFDKLEDKVRGRLSHYPILYALIGAIGIILVWKGVWEVAEQYAILHGIGSVALGVIILLITGLFVSFFIGDNIILSGFRREKKLIEKTEAEIKADRSVKEIVFAKLDTIEKEVQEIKEEVGHHPKD